MKPKALTLLLLMILEWCGYGCKKTIFTPLLVDDVVGNYIMHGANYYTYLAWDSSHTNVVDMTDTTAIYNDTITVSTYSGLQVVVSGVPCTYLPGSSPYSFSSNSGSSFMQLVFYKNSHDSAMFTFGGRTIETTNTTVLSGRKI